MNGIRQLASLKGLVIGPNQEHLLGGQLLDSQP